METFSTNSGGRDTNSHYRKLAPGPQPKSHAQKKNVLDQSAIHDRAPPVLLVPANSKHVVCQGQAPEKIEESASQIRVYLAVSRDRS